MVYGVENHGLPYQSSTANCIPRDDFNGLSCENFNSANIPLHSQISSTIQNGRKRGSIVTPGGCNIDLSGLTREERRRETIEWWNFVRFSNNFYEQEDDVQRPSTEQPTQPEKEFELKLSTSLSPNFANFCRPCHQTRNCRKSRFSSWPSVTSLTWIMSLKPNDPTSLAVCFLKFPSISIKHRVGKSWLLWSHIWIMWNIKWKQNLTTFPHLMPGEKIFGEVEKSLIKWTFFV